MGSIRPRSFSEYLQLFWRRKWLFLSVTGITLIALLIIISRLPNVYESKAAIVVTGKQEDRQSIADRVAAVRERLTSRAFLEGIAKDHPNSMDEVGSMDEAVDLLRRDTKVETTMRGDFPESLTLTYRNKNPQIAKDVATGLVSVFGSMNEAVEKQMTAEEESLNTELNGIENRLEQMGKRASSHRAFRGSGRPSIDVSAIRAERAAATSSIETLTDKQFTLEREIAEQKRQIAEQQKIVKQSPGDAHSSGSLGVLLVRKAELEAQIKEYSTQYTEKNPKVLQSRSQLEEINRQINEVKSDAQNNSSVNSPEARELRSMQRELARMETELEVTQRTMDRKKQALDSTPAASNLAAAHVASAPSVGSTEIDTPPVGGSDYERMKNRYDSLLRRQERLQNERLTAAGLDPGLFQIVDMPAVPQVPSGPNRTKYRLLALIISLLVGLIVVAAVEIPKLFQIRDDRDVEYYLGSPVIVLIPESAMASDHGRARRMVSGSIGVLLVLAVLIPALLFFLNNYKVIHLLTGLLSR